MWCFRCVLMEHDVKSKSKGNDEKRIQEQDEDERLQYFVEHSNIHVVSEIVLIIFTFWIENVYYSHLASLGCLAIKVISSAQDRIIAVAARFLFTLQGSFMESSGTHKMTPIRHIMIISSQFSGETKYRFKDPVIWKASRNICK